MALLILSEAKLCLVKLAVFSCSTIFTGAVLTELKVFLAP